MRTCPSSDSHERGEGGISSRATPCPSSSSEYMFAYLENKAELLQMGMGGGEGGVGGWTEGWRVVFRGAALHQRKGNSLFGTLAGGEGG